MQTALITMTMFGPAWSFSGAGSCPDGQFDDYDGWGGCRECPAGKWRGHAIGLVNYVPFATSDNGCWDCKSLRVSDDHTVCNYCPAGKYANQGCDYCEEGKYQDWESLDECMLCADGLTSTSDYTGCENCPAGRYSNWDRKCKPCTGNKVSYAGEDCTRCVKPKSPNSDHTDCVCPAGQIPVYGTFGDELADCVQCDHGKRASADQKSCEACPEGHEPNADQDGCSRCSSDEVSDGSICRVCDTGKFPNRRQSGCVRCREGQVSSGDTEDCHSCPGQTVPNHPRTACVHCHPPQYPNSDRDGCANCTGRKTITDGVCEDCPPGAISNHHHTKCHQCPGSEVPTDDGMDCHICDKNKIPNADRTGCQSCAKNAVPSKNQTHCQRCTGATVPDQTGVRCKKCSSPKVPFYNNEVCARCETGRIPTHDGSRCKDCGTNEVPNRQGLTCMCIPGWARDGLSCKACTNDTIANKAGTRCDQCGPGTEADIHHIHCLQFDRKSFLIHQWPIMVPALLIYLGLVLGGHFYLKIHRPEGYLLVGEESEEARAVNKSRCWTACCCGYVEPKAWPWQVLGTWDLIDWLLYVFWFISGKPADQESAEFEGDLMVSMVCSTLIWFGGFLPALMLVLPRQAYVAVEFVYDALELATVSYVAKFYGFKSNHGTGTKGKTNWNMAILAAANVAATWIDGIILKGPEALDYSLTFFSTCVNMKLKSCHLREDVKEFDVDLPTTIEAYLVFQKNDTIEINDDEHEVKAILTNSIVVHPALKKAHNKGSLVNLHKRNGEIIQRDKNGDTFAGGGLEAGLSVAGAATAGVAASAASTIAAADDRGYSPAREIQREFNETGGQEAVE